MSSNAWIFRWKNWIAPTPVKPGVWRRKEGGYLVRGRVTDPRTGKLREVKLVVKDRDATGAYQFLQEELQALRLGGARQKHMKMRFSTFAASLYERKVVTGELKSAKGREKWESILRRHLLPPFGDFFVEELRRTEIEAWRLSVGRRIKEGEVSPHTANGWLSILRVIIGAAVIELEITHNPMLGLKDFDTSEHPAYTDEEPNSLTATEAREFLAAMRAHFPQHFAMTALGFATGLRPSSLRPLRRQGETPDVIWDQGTLLIRQSHTRHQEVMKTTKTKRNQRLTLPPDLMEILRWHVAELPDGPMRESGLLFPSDLGGYRSPSCLDKPFKAVVKIIGLKKRLTPRGMRRTFQDLARAAEVRDVVTRAVSGHVTEAMQRHYSTVAPDEMRQGLAKVVSLAGFREAMEAAQSGGAKGGATPHERKKAGSEDFANQPISKDFGGAGDGT